VFVHEYVKAAARDAEVFVVHLVRDGTRRMRFERWEQDGIRGLRVRFPGGRAWFAWQLAAARAAWRRLPFDPDVIYAHFAITGVPAALLGRLHRKPVVISENWGIFLESNPEPVTAPIKLAARVAFGGADLVLPVSEATAQPLRELGVRTPMRLLPNIVDDSLFHPPPARPVAGVPRLLTVALFYAGFEGEGDIKGVDLAIEALARLDRPVRLDIVGDGVRRGSYEELTGRLGLGDAVTFHGIQPKERIAELMREADAFVLPSRFDNNPVALLEALVSGLPVVATGVGGTPELIDDRNGLLVRPDADSIAAGITSLLERLESYDRSAIADDARARFGADPIARRLSEALNDAVALRGGR
jgi:glycosyltransferase involved in cell wall biosynthesis